MDGRSRHAERCSKVTSIGVYIIKNIGGVS